MRAPIRSGLDELLDTGVPHAHERKLGRGKKGIGCHQEQDEKHPEQHEGDHRRVILNIRAGVRVQGSGLGVSSAHRFGS